MSVPYYGLKEELDERLEELDSEDLMDLIGEPKGEIKEKIDKKAFAVDLLPGSFTAAFGYFFSRALGISSSLSIGAGVSAAAVSSGIYFTLRKATYGTSF